MHRFALILTLIGSLLIPTAALAEPPPDDHLATPTGDLFVLNGGLVSADDVRAAALAGDLADDHGIYYLAGDPFLQARYPEAAGIVFASLAEGRAFVAARDALNDLHSALPLDVPQGPAVVASAPCPAPFTYGARWYDGTFTCSGDWSGIFRTEWQPNMGTYGWANRPSAIYISNPGWCTQYIWAFVDTNYNGSWGLYSNTTASPKWQTIGGSYNNNYESYTSDCD